MNETARDKVLATHFFPLIQDKLSEKDADLLLLKAMREICTEFSLVIFEQLPSIRYEHDKFNNQLAKQNEILMLIIVYVLYE